MLYVLLVKKLIISFIFFFFFAKYVLALALALFTSAGQKNSATSASAASFKGHQRYNQRRQKNSLARTALCSINVSQHALSKSGKKTHTYENPYDRRAYDLMSGNLFQRSVRSLFTAILSKKIMLIQYIKLVKIIKMFSARKLNNCKFYLIISNFI